MSKSKFYKFFVIFSIASASIPFWFIFGDNASAVNDWVFLLSGMVFLLNSIVSFFFPGSRMWKVSLKFGDTKVFIYNWLLIILGYPPISYLSYSTDRYSVIFYLIALAFMPISQLRIKLIREGS